MKARTVFIEGWLYFYTAFGTSAITYLSTEESYKYCDPQWRFWIIVAIGSSVAGFNAVKAYRSMTFARHNNQPEPTKTP